jgi:hypothetical protein
MAFDAAAAQQNNNEMMNIATRKNRFERQISCYDSSDAHVV